MTELEEAMHLADHVEKIVKPAEMRPVWRHLVVMNQEIKRLRRELVEAREALKGGSLY